MKRCFWYRRRKSRKGSAINDVELREDSDDDGMKNEIWFDSKLVFESDSEDDFQSVNGDSSPASFGYSYTSQGAPRRSFTSLKERMEALIQEKGPMEDQTRSASARNAPEGKKTLGQLFTAKSEEGKGLENEEKPSEIFKQEAKLDREISQKSCFSGLFQSMGSGKKTSSSTVTQKRHNAESWVPYRLCAS